MRSMNISEEGFLGIGLAVPGPVGPDGIVNGCVNLGWGPMDVSGQLSERLSDVKVVVGNDANLAALGEDWQGAGRNYSSSVVVTLGTGVGGGLVSGGRLLTGAHGVAGEIGHLRVNSLEQQQCSCSGFGCLEQYASAPGFLRLANQLMEGQLPPDFTCQQLFDEAKAGDPVALQAVELGCGYLAQGLQAIAVTFDPQAFIIGGGVSKAGEFLLNIIRREYPRVAYYGCRDVEIVLAELGNSAGIYGAAKTLLDSL